jgi:hypothetical protein
LQKHGHARQSRWRKRATLQWEIDLWGKNRAADESALEGGFSDAASPLAFAQ